MKSTRHFNIFLAIFALLFFTAACQPEAVPSITGKAGQADHPSSAPAEAKASASVPGPSGQTTALLADPAAGLANVKSYQAVLTQNVNGNLDNQAFERYTHIEYRRDAAGNKEIKQHIIGTGAVPFDRHQILYAGAMYELNETAEQCSGSMPQQDAGELFAPPAHFLIPVGKALPAGEETVNEVQARHFAFDESGLIRAEAGSAVSGEVWLAEDGGQVVRYTLTINAPPNLTGKGLEASQNWRYDLTFIPADAIQLPASCLPVIMDIPVTADAEEVERTGWMTSYHTASTVKEVFRFYQQKLAASGWRLMNESLPDSLKLPYPLNAEKDKLVMTIQLNEGENGGLDVDVHVTNLDGVEGFAQVTPQATPARQPTLDPSAAGLPDDIPLYPGSYGLKKLANGTLVLMTGGRLNAVSKFYYDKMDELGWWILETHSLADSETATWVKEKRQVMFAATQKGSEVQIMISQATTP